MIRPLIVVVLCLSVGILALIGLLRVAKELIFKDAEHVPGQRSVTKR